MNRSRPRVEGRMAMTGKKHSKGPKENRTTPKSLTRGMVAGKRKHMSNTRALAAKQLLAKGGY